LPPGRHKLGRDAVLTSRRERIVAATLDYVAAKGYAGDDGDRHRVHRSGGTQRLLRLFADNQDCFLACCDAEATIAADRRERAYTAYRKMMEGSHDEPVSRSPNLPAPHRDLVEFTELVLMGWHPSARQR
jgi:hypothetical protein